jgi:hypothetical protein
MTFVADDNIPRMVRFGENLVRIGHLQTDGSMLVPMDCVIEAAQSLGAGRLARAAETLKRDDVLDMLQSGEELIDRVGDARERKVRELVTNFQEADQAASSRRWKQIEKMVFGMDYPDQACLRLTGGVFPEVFGSTCTIGCAFAR